VACGRGPSRIECMSPTKGASVQNVVVASCFVQSTYECSYASYGAPDDLRSSIVRRPGSNDKWMPTVWTDQSPSTERFLVSWRGMLGARETARNDCVLVPTAMPQPVRRPVKHSGHAGSRKANVPVMNQLKSPSLLVAALPATLRPVGVLRPDPLKRLLSFARRN
jgi:hypothetical protein